MNDKTKWGLRTRSQKSAYLQRKILMDKKNNSTKSNSGTQNIGPSSLNRLIG